MTHVQQSVVEEQGYRLHVVKTTKYKTNTIILKLKAPLDRETVSYRALLPQVLQGSSKKYPTTGKLRTYLEELYGATLYGNVSKKGEYHIMTLTIEIANEKFLSDKDPLLEKGIQLLTDVLLNPNIEEGGFRENTFDQEKRALIQQIQSLYDDKMKYSSIRLVEEMCKDEPYGIGVNGTVEGVGEITPHSLYDYYRHAIETDEVDLYVVGDVDEGQIRGIVTRYMHLKSRQTKSLPVDHHNQPREVKEIKEVQDITQGKLNMGYRTGILYGDKDYYALQVFNGIFGGFSHSKLFMEVREKNSLAYYCASRIESHKGLIMVMSGIQTENYQKTLSIINEQMDKMKRGDFSDEIIDQTKAVIINQLLETIDNAGGLTEILYHNVISKQTLTIDDWLTGIQNVTKEDIIRVGERIHLDTVYFLAGKGEL
ncbi:MAG: EF-P 5-aminopentanol modification-associated protein YfmF [Bacillus sp. (in: firmicutes)]